MDKTEGDENSSYNPATNTVTFSASDAKAVKRAKLIMKEEAPSETWVRKAYKKTNPSFLKVYINGEPHFKIFSAQRNPEFEILRFSTNFKKKSRIKFVVSDDTLRVARACGFRLTKDEEWIIQKTEDGINHSLTRFLGRTVRMDRVY